MAKSNVVVALLTKAERSALNKLAHELSQRAYMEYSRYLIDQAEKQKAADGCFDIELRPLLAPFVIEISSAIKKP